MDKSIRSYAKTRFLELTPERAGSADRKVNLTWRKKLLVELMEKFTCTIAAASTHYNEAFKAAKALSLQPGQETLAAQLVGLGRPEDKKGGRKKKVQGPAAEQTDTPVAPAIEQTEEQKAALAADAAQQAVMLYSVFRKKDDELIASGLTRDQADALIDKARVAKKAALYLESEQQEAAPL
jgi:hypothetical protein